MPLFVPKADYKRLLEQASLASVHLRELRNAEQRLQELEERLRKSQDEVRGLKEENKLHEAMRREHMGMAEDLAYLEAEEREVEETLKKIIVSKESAVDLVKQGRSWCVYAINSVRSVADRHGECKEGTPIHGQNLSEEEKRKAEATNNIHYGLRSLYALERVFADLGVLVKKELEEDDFLKNVDAVLKDFIANYKYLTDPSILSIGRGDIGTVTKEFKRLMESKKEQHDYWGINWSIQRETKEIIKTINEATDNLSNREIATQYPEYAHIQGDIKEALMKIGSIIAEFLNKNKELYERILPEESNLIASFEHDFNVKIGQRIQDFNDMMKGKTNT